MNEASMNHHFTSGELINPYEMNVMETVRMCLGQNYVYFVEYPLQKICYRPETAPRNLTDEQWKFWVNSHVDIAVMKWGYNSDRRARLVVEVQSKKYHDDKPGQLRRDAMKADMLRLVGVPLIYARHSYGNVYRFYTPSGEEEILVNYRTNWGMDKLQDFLKRYCL